MSWQEIGRECGTDKATHTYMPVYERFLGPLAPQPIRLLELGVDQGKSLAMWLKLFPSARIHGLDHRDCCEVLSHRMNVHRRYQHDPALSHFFGGCEFDAIVDDGSHRREHQRSSVGILWPWLKSGGYYFIEDILTDEYPNEVAWWRNDPDCVWAEANQEDIFGNYCRSDAIVVLQKTSDRPMHHLYDAPEIRHTLWPCFFAYMEQSCPPDVRPWNWIDMPDLWRPVFDDFLRGKLSCPGTLGTPPRTDVFLASPTASEELRQAFLAATQDRSTSIHEHLLTMRDTASGQRHITEMGVGDGWSTLAWLLVQPKKVVCYDRSCQEVFPKLRRLAGRTELCFFEMGSTDADIEETDLLFLDTTHTYDQLRDELALHAPKVRRFIVLHDTTTFGDRGEDGKVPGLWRAVTEFVAGNAPWKVLSRWHNCNGLTILQKGT